jgi:hypothetical protein
MEFNLVGFDNLLHEPEIEDGQLPLPTPSKETANGNKCSECVLPNKWSSSTLLSPSSQDHPTRNLLPHAAIRISGNQADSRKRHISGSLEDGLLQRYVVISTDELPTEGGNDRLYMAGQHTKKETKSCRFKDLMSTRFSLPKSAKHLNGPGTTCVTEAARVPPAGKEKEEPELSSSFYNEETEGQ